MYWKPLTILSHKLALLQKVSRIAFFFFNFCSSFWMVILELWNVCKNVLKTHHFHKKCPKLLYIKLLWIILEKRGFFLKIYWKPITILSHKGALLQMAFTWCFLLFRKWMVANNEGNPSLYREMCRNAFTDIWNSRLSQIPQSMGFWCNLINLTDVRIQ